MLTIDQEVTTTLKRDLFIARHHLQTAKLDVLAKDTPAHRKQVETAQQAADGLLDLYLALV